MTKNLLDELWQEVFECELGKVYRLDVGALELYISCLENEWQFRYRYATEDEMVKEKKINLTTLKSFPSIELEQLRFIHSTGESSLRFKPVLANRSIVAKPYQPIYLPPKQKVTIYISTPVWVSVTKHDSTQPLLELPSYKLSDTWFGPKPIVGELSYSSHFSGRVDLKSLPKRASRIITPVTVTNNGEDNLKLEKVSIPCDYLEVYQTESNELWTPALSVSRVIEKKNTRVRIDKSQLPVLESAKKLSEPRKTDQSALLSKTIDMLFS